MRPESFPVVGIGASAGGLQALEALFGGLPSDTGMAFVIVTHLARGRESLLPEIIGRRTNMPTGAAEDRELIEPDRVYFCPPDHVLTVGRGRLHLHPRESEKQQKPIDVFLSSLAEDRGVGAVGILLSGAGSDGALGIKAIKERGGFTLAQGSDGSGPQHADMPETAIAAGVIDLVVPVDEMGARLAEHAANFHDVEMAVAQTQADESDSYQEVYRLLLDQIGHDFSGYKQKTFQRRVRRRMQVLQVERLDAYVERLRTDPGEVTLLFRDLLIGVTNFFRDREAFETLQREIFPRLFAGRGASDTVRIWVPGCATGEEVYSLAILAREHMDTLRSSPKVQIFATDIDEAALAIARSGRYPVPLMDNVSPERLQRFFTHNDATVVVNKDLREMCVFSPHSVLRDPPFSRMDLISCRNLLIYLGSEFQGQVIPVFHFALRPGGYLFLGTSENISQHSDLFAPVDRKQRIFQRRDHAIAPVHITAFNHLRPGPVSFEHRHDSGHVAINLRRGVEARMLERFTPAHVVVDRDGNIVHYSPRTGKYLEPATGLPSRQLAGMARRGLRLDLRAALREAIEGWQRAERTGVAIELEDRVQLIDLLIEPLGERDADPLFLVVFRDVGAPFVPGDTTRQGFASESERNHERTERDLRDTRERLQSTVEEYETALEELKSSNEELQSVNEELQSTNEELETSKEELQSLNEELHTVNAELTAKVDEVDAAHSDLRNLLASTRIGVVFLDRQLVIRSFTPAVADIFNLISTDKGRPLTDIVSNVALADLERDIRTVLERGETIERNVARLDGRAHYLMRILPYRGHNDLIEGVLVTFVDVTRNVEAEAYQRTLVEELNHRVRNMLAVVNAIAHQTLKQSGSLESFAEAFGGRIRAMGSAYTLVSSRDWDEVALGDILAEQLRPYGLEASGRIVVDGPEVLFAPGASLALSLVVHELATNAVKYGALSRETGRVHMDWRVDENAKRLVIAWREEGGPETKKPIRKGFGSELIEREVTSALNGEVKFEYASAGFAAVMSIPLASRAVSGTA